MRPVARLLTAITVAVALFSVPSVANAASAPTVGSLTAQQVETLATAVEAQQVLKLVAPARTTYTLTSGSTVVVEQPRSTGGLVTPQFSVGAGWGIYIYLNRSDQMVVAAGGAAGLAVLICAATVLIGCAAATAALAGAATWVAVRGGICPSRLEIHTTVATTSFKCVA